MGGGAGWIAAVAGMGFVAYGSRRVGRCGRQVGEGDGSRRSLLSPLNPQRPAHQSVALIIVEVAFFELDDRAQLLDISEKVFKLVSVAPKKPAQNCNQNNQGSALPPHAMYKNLFKLLQTRNQILITTSAMGGSVQCCEQLVPNRCQDVLHELLEFNSVCEEQIDIEAGFDDGFRVWVHDEATAEEVMRRAQRVDPIDVLNTLEKLRVGSCAAASYEATTSHLEDRRSGPLAKIG